MSTKLWVCRLIWKCECFSDFYPSQSDLWHNSARLELYLEEGGGSQDLMLYLMLSIRMKLLIFWKEKKKGERETLPFFP